MAQISIPQAQSEVNNYWYDSDWLKWKGYYDDIPLLRGIFNGIADSVTASWTLKGNNANKVQSALDNFEGNGKETFKTMMCNAIKSAMISGDAYFEIITNNDLGVENMVMLPTDNIRIIIKNGRIKRYEEKTAPPGDQTSKWKPEEIFHYVNNPIGAMVHGTSDIAPLQTLLYDLKQVQDNMAKLYDNYATPKEVVSVDAEPSEVADFKTEYMKMKHTNPKVIFMTKGMAEMQMFGLPAGSTLDPAVWHRLIVEQMLSSMRVPDLALGAGTVNSEESARMKYDGYRQLIRMKQQLLEEQLQRQLFPQIVTNAPTIEFSYAAEPEEERFNRLMAAFSQVNASELAPDIKGLTLIKLLQDAGVIPNE